MLMQKLEQDLREALKAKDTLKLDTLRMLKASISNFLIEKKKTTAEDREILSLIQKQAKLRQDAIDAYKKGGRQDLADKEGREKTLLESYLPKPLSETELRTLLTQVIAETKASSKADLGKVMKEAVARAQGRADGKKISELASTMLA